MNALHRPVGEAGRAMVLLLVSALLLARLPKTACANSKRESRDVPHRPLTFARFV